MSMKILLAEDEEDLQLIFKMVLEDESHTVTVVNNGYEVLERLANDTFDLLLIDVMMPQMDGLELCERIQDHPVWRQIPILLLTAKPKSSLSLKDLPPMVRGLIEKPFNVFQLIDEVRTILAST
ncbi:MAG: response regulator [Chloroflexus aggregans]|uniref:Response regulator n=1 Tax=Chloroflexus aggregans TaxID=152260 RepID=A0A2J6WTK0_9CHLR|nr:MAG: response regulator [Chloroflexus aggregans]